MRDRLDAEDVLSDIEFELAQGAISHDDLGQAIRAVRRYQNELRSSVLQSSRRVKNDRQVVAQLFQVNDMLIALLQEAAAAIQSLRLDLRRSVQALRGGSAVGGADTPAPGVDIPAPVADAAMWEQVGAGLGGQSVARIERLMHPDTLRVGIEAPPARIPIIGGLLRRLRIGFHSLVLFYVKLLAEKQVLVNQAYGDEMLRLIERHQLERQKIEMLAVRIERLEERLAEFDSGEPGFESKEKEGEK